MFDRTPRRPHSPRCGALALAGALLLTALPSFAATSRERQAELTPAAVLQAMKDGNERFVAGRTTNQDLRSQIAATAGGQYPHSVILGCVDSRVPPELVFDQGIGDVFSIRVAGNFANTDIIGSMEFATQVAGSKLIVVLGHTSCGAVMGAVDGVQLDNLTHLLSSLSPAVYSTDPGSGPRSSENAAYVDAVASTNVRMTIDRILRNSDVIEGLVDDGSVMIVGALYDVSTGKVTFLD